MGDLTKNISRHELRCHCGKCEFSVEDYEPVVKAVQMACDHFADTYSITKVALQITSPARCREHNLKIGSNDRSQHVRGRALDIKLFINLTDQIPPKLVYKYLDKRFPNKLGLGLYDSFTHVDTRPVKARWDWRSKE
jgi:uncharacterized protein YcbK (DUF882 family)